MPAKYEAPASRLKILTPWLYTVTRRTAIDVIRKESRRQLREQIAVEMTNMNATGSRLDANRAAARRCHGLRSTKPTAARFSCVILKTKACAKSAKPWACPKTPPKNVSVGLSTDCANSFSKRKVTVGASGLAVLISANAVQSAPIGLAVTISAAAVLAGTTVSTSTVITATKTIAMTTLQKTLINCHRCCVTGAGIYEARQATNARTKSDAPATASAADRANPAIAERT